MKNSSYKEIRKKAWNFCKSIEVLDIDAITLFLKKQNFAVKYFEPDDENILALNPAAGKEKGFVYRSSALRMVCVLKSLSVREKIKTLIHETGHVLLDEDFDTCSYKQTKAVKFSKCVKQTFEQPSVKYKLWKNNSSLMLACLMSLSFLCLSVAYMSFGSAKNKGSEAQTGIVAEYSDKTDDKQIQQVYVTPTGKKYHIKECTHIHLETAKPLTIEEAEKRNYAPCKHCSLKVE